MRTYFLVLAAIIMAVGFSSRPANASVIGALTDYDSGSYYIESGTLQANSSAVFDYTLTPAMVDAISLRSQVIRIYQTATGGGAQRVAVSQYSQSDPTILSLSGGTGIYNATPTALAKDQITLSGNDLFITLVNYSPTSTYNFLNQFTLGGAPAVVNGTIVSQGSLSAVPLPASFPLFAAIIAGMVGFGVYRKRQTV